MKRRKTQGKNFRALSKKDMKSITGGEVKCIGVFIDGQWVVIETNRQKSLELIS